MNEKWITIGVTALVLIVLGAIVIYFISRALRHMGEKLGKHLIDRFFQFLKRQEDKDETHPKSLLNMEESLMPKILKDFPGFDLAMAKNQVKDYVMERYKTQLRQFEIHDIVLAEYRRYNTGKKLVFYLSVSYRQKKLLQRRMEVVMQFQQVKGKTNPAITCPNCGATLGFNQLECEYCGTRINDSRDQEWGFASVREF